MTSRHSSGGRLKSPVSRALVDIFCAVTLLVSSCVGCLASVGTVLLLASFCVGFPGSLCFGRQI